MSPDQGGAEGVMCAIGALANAGDNPPPRNNATVKPWIPNCVSDLGTASPQLSPLLFTF